MKIEYDDYYKCWVVWKKEGSGMFELYRGLKKDCKAFAKKEEKREKRKKHEHQSSNWI